MCSEDKPADFTDEAFASMQEKHPARFSDMSSLPDPRSFSSISVSENEVLKAVLSFPAGSSGGLDGLRPSRPSNVVDLLACKTNGPVLLTALTKFVNLVLGGGCPLSVCCTFFGARLIAVDKKAGGFRPIAVGYTLRRLVAKCANNYAQVKLFD